VSNCPFCQIASKQRPTQLRYESDDVVAFDDANPSAPIHILIVPKKHIPTFLDIGAEDAEILLHMAQAAQHLIRERSLQHSSYRMVFNGGSLQHVPHLHWHLVSRGG
jgi:histidine triad (HIT) family protein